MNPTAFGILALSASGSRGGLARSAAWLRSAQNADGGWGFARGRRQRPRQHRRRAPGARRGGRQRRGDRQRRRLAAAKPGPGRRLRGRRRRTERAVDRLGGAGSDRRRGLAAAVRNGGSPLDYLASVRAPDGHFRYSASSDQTPVWVTGQALVAARGKAFPLAPVAKRRAGRRGLGERRAEGKRRRARCELGRAGAAAPAAPGAKPGKAQPGPTAAQPTRQASGRGRSRSPPHRRARTRTTAPIRSSTFWSGRARRAWRRDLGRLGPLPPPPA